MRIFVLMFRLIVPIALATWLCAAVAQTALPDLPRSYQHSSNLVTAGQPARTSFPDIGKAGIELVINLSPTNLPGTVRDEQQVVETAGMKYVHIPVDWDKPSLDDLAAFFDVMDKNKGRKVLVHCWLNARSSAFVYAYRTLREGAPEAAERDVLTKIWDNNKGYELRNAPQWGAFLAQAGKRFSK